MADISTNVRSVNGQSLGPGDSSFFDPFYLFKGKLRAASQRAKFHDSADLRWLGSHYWMQIKARANELNPLFVGLAMRRYAILERLFEDLGVDVEKAKEAAKDIDLDKLPRPAPGDVQTGILG